MTVFEPVIGLEVHAQLSTRSKLFCACSTAFGGSPNAHTCAVCLGMPGVLPTLNEHAVHLAVRCALGLGSAVQPRAQWSRKNYFYPDLPKGYQITQFEHPLARGGEIAFELDGAPHVGRLNRIHMEEDAGKSVHDAALAGQRSYVDFNRGGTPLVEIVGEPDLPSAAAAAAYFKTLRQILRFLAVCDGNMEEGSLRCDANVSVRPVGQTKLGNRVEIKNLNSFKFLQQAIEHEVARQTQCIADGGSVAQETRLWDPQDKVTRTMRSKEDAHDYRYFPEPDLPDLALDPQFIANIANTLPELPAAKRQRYVHTLQLSEYDAQILIDDAEVAQFFEAAIAKQPNVKAVANWIINDILGELKGRSLSSVPITGVTLAELVGLIDDGTLSGKLAKDVLAHMLREGGSPKDIVAKKGLVQVSDASALLPIVRDTLAQNPDSVAAYRAGKTTVLGFLVGQVMKKTQGKANPQRVNELLRAQLQDAEG